MSEPRPFRLSGELVLVTQVLLWGKSIQSLQKHILQEVAKWQAKWPQKRSFLVVPETRKLMIENAYLQTHKESSLLLTDVLSFSRLAQLLAEEMGLQPEQFLDESGKMFLLRRILAELDAEKKLHKLGTFVHKLGFLRELAVILGELHRCSLHGSEILEKLDSERLFLPKQKLEMLQDIALLMEAYETKLQEQSWLDTETKMALLEEKLAFIAAWLEEGKDISSLPFPYSRLAFLQKTSIWVLGFAEQRNFTPQEWQILSSLGKICPELWLTILSDQEPRIQLVAAGQKTDVHRKTAVLLDPFLAGKQVGKQFLKIFPTAQIIAVPVPEEKKAEDKSYYLIQAMNQEEEVRLCCAELLRLHELGMSWQEMGIICTDVRVLTALRTAMYKLKIPLFIDERISLGNRPLIRYLLGFFALAEQGFSRSAVCQFLRSGLVGLTADEIDLLENLWLERGMTGHKIFMAARYQVSWLLSEEDGEVVAEVKDEKEDGQEGEKQLSTLKERFERCWSLVQQYLRPCYDFWQEMGQLQSDPRVHPCSYWLAQLTSFMQKQGVERFLQGEIDICLKRQDEEAATAHVKSWQELGKVFERMILFLEDTPLSLAFLAASLQDIFNNRYAENLPVALDQVMVGQLPQFLGLVKKCIYVLGATFHSFPTGFGQESFFNDDLRQDLARIIGDEQRQLPLYQEAVLHQPSFYQAIFQSLFSERLYFSGCDADAWPDLVGLWEKKGYWQKIQPVNAALMLPDDMRLVFPDYKEIYGALRSDSVQCKKKISNLRNAPESVQLRADLVAELLTERPQFSISKLEKYRRCPYQYFIHYLLQVKPRPEWQPQSAEMGTLLHKVLELYFKEEQEAARAGDEVYEAWLAEQPNLSTAETIRRQFAQAWIEKAIDDSCQAEDKKLMVFREAGIYESITR